MQSASLLVKCTKQFQNVMISVITEVSVITLETVTAKMVLVVSLVKYLVLVVLLTVILPTRAEVRKAPPPPGGRRHLKRESLSAMWGDGVLNYSVNERPPSFMPPAIPLVSINPSSPQARSSDHLLTHVSVSSPSSKLKATFTRVPSMRPKEPPPVVPSRPRESRIAELYRERGAEMGILSPVPVDFASRDLPSPPANEEGVSMKKDAVRPVQPPPLPPSKHLKPSLNLENVDRPPLPQKPPKVLGRTETGVDVRELAAKFDAKLHSKMFSQLLPLTFCQLSIMAGYIAVTQFI
ncbi:unnamed protein product [Angiostrongylus costaricensis]|uniref:Transmembrane protein n=1 Tax=Angiostrongylus costaricensis TaxID=334426 RepID=A0A0R3PLW1_ANGCS|nr:unnamed protein product [Angiostrongylus costaricensis]